MFLHDPLFLRADPAMRLRQLHRLEEELRPAWGSAVDELARSGLALDDARRLLDWAEARHEQASDRVRQLRDHGLHLGRLRAVAKNELLTAMLSDPPPPFESGDVLV